MIAGESNWQLRGRCRDHPVEVFFPDELRGRVAQLWEAEAMSICRSCPVIEQCRDHALRMPEPYGIWGATTAQDRRRQLASTRRR
jgi:WhiB family transcriptional regulator, redox-sensing transcriptional regulator